MESAEETTSANAQKDGMETIVKSDEFNDRFVRNRARMGLVNQTAHANARKAGVESFVIIATNVEETHRNPREDKSESI